MDIRGLNHILEAIPVLGDTMGSCRGPGLFVNRRVLGGNGRQEIKWMGHYMVMSEQEDRGSLGSVGRSS
jgi:hypothetical protein